MNVKRYLAEDAAEAMKKIKAELGSDVVILNTRRIKRKGFFGFFKKPMVEVVAAYEQPSLRQSAPSAPAVPAVSAPAPEKTSKNRSDKETPASPPPEKETSFEDVFTKAKEAPPDAPLREARIKNLEEKLDSLSMLISDMSARMDASYLQDERKPLPPMLEQLRTRFLEHEVHAEVLLNIFGEAEALMEKEGLEPTDAAELSLLTLLGNPAPLDPVNGGRKIVLLCGPTGVGKTTTLAKLAAKYALSEDAKTGIITTDTFRIAAVDQLKTYAEIMELPIEIAYSLDEIPGLLDRFSDFDLVFIDTAGRSPSDPILQEETERLIEKSGADEVFLVLSATTSFSGCLRILDTYSFLANYKLLFTKIDESESLGIIPNVRYLTEKPLTYLSVGQRVPDDIEVADASKIADRLMGRKRI